MSSTFVPWNGQSYGLPLPSPQVGIPGNVTMLDSAVFRTMFGNEDMRAIFCDLSYCKRLVEVEIALAKVEADLNIIPRWAADQIAQYSDASKIDLQALRHETDIVGYSILPLVRQIAGMCGEAGKFVHVGFNTQDIHDLAVSLQIKEGLDLIDGKIQNLRKNLVEMAKKYRNAIQMGRTHLQHALPVTFGYKCAIWLAMLDRHSERLQQIRPRALVASIGGASGSLASMGMGSENQLPDGIRTIDAICEYLGLTKSPISVHTSRDHVTEMCSFLAMVCGSLGKIAYDVMLMSSHEIDEVREPFIPHRGASSTMPHKRNPISSEIIMATARLTRSSTATAFDCLVSDFERATGPWHLEFACIPEIFTYTSNSLTQATFMLSNLDVDVKRMEKNLKLSNGLIMAEYVLTGLMHATGRVQAHDLVYECCKECIETGEPLVNILKRSTDVTKHMSDEQIDAHMDERKYLGSVLAMVDETVAGR